MASHWKVPKPFQAITDGVLGHLLVEHELGDSTDDLIPNQGRRMQIRVGLDPFSKPPMNLRGAFIAADQSDEQA